MNAKYFYPYNYEAREDNIIVNEFRIDLYSSNALDTIRKCIPLFGEEVIYSWKNYAREYPKQIAINNINDVLQSID